MDDIDSSNINNNEFEYQETAIFDEKKPAHAKPSQVKPAHAKPDSDYLYLENPPQEDVYFEVPSRANADFEDSPQEDEYFEIPQQEDTVLENPPQEDTYFEIPSQEGACPENSSQEDVPEEVVLDDLTTVLPSKVDRHTAKTIPFEKKGAVDYLGTDSVDFSNNQEIQPADYLSADSPEFFSNQETQAIPYGYTNGQENQFSPYESFADQETQVFYPEYLEQPGQVDQASVHDEALAFLMNQDYTQADIYAPAAAFPQSEEEPAPKKSRKKLFIILGIVFALLCVCAGLAWAAHVSLHDYIAQVEAQNEQNAQVLEEWKKARNVDLANIPETGQKVETYGLASMGATEGEKDAHVQKIEALIADYEKSGLISFEAYSLDGKSAISYNTTLAHYSACTIKAPYIYWCCQQLENGKGSLWDTMKLESAYIFPGSGVIKDRALGTSFTIEELIYYTMFVSDNTAYNMLYSYFGGGEEYNTWILSAGMPSLTVEGLWGYNIKATDLTKVWKLYYDYFQSSQSDVRNALYKACTNSYAAFACEHMPYTYSHKSGNTYYPDEQYNDAGIIWIEGHPYAFAFLSRTEGEGWDSGVICEIMNEISALMSKDDPQPNAPEVEIIAWTWDGWLDTVLPWRTPATSE